MTFVNQFIWPLSGIRWPEETGVTTNLGQLSGETPVPSPLLMLGCYASNTYKGGRFAIHDAVAIEVRDRQAGSGCGRCDVVAGSTMRRRRWYEVRW